jgi:hypothetical protein
MPDQPIDGLTDEQFRNVVLALHAPLVAELRAFGIPTADTDPLDSVRLLIARCHDLVQRTDTDAAYERGKAEHAAELARVEALLDHAVQHSIMVVKTGKDAYERGLAEGRRQATEGWERKWAVQTPEGLMIPVREHDGLASMVLQAEQRAAGLRTGTTHSRLVGPWEPAGQQPEHAFDESSVVNPAAGEPYPGSSGPEPYEPPDSLCVCGASWLGDEGCLTQQPGWTPPPPYNGPAEQHEAAS